MSCPTVLGYRQKAQLQLHLFLVRKPKIVTFYHDQNRQQNEMNTAIYLENVPQIPLTPCTALAPTGSSTAHLSNNGIYMIQQL